MTPNSIVNQKDKFRKEVKRLTSELHVKHQAISEALNIPTHKVAQVVNDRSFKYEDGMLNKLYKKFPQLQGSINGISNTSKPDDPIKDLQRTVEHLEKTLLEKLEIAKEFEKRMAAIERQNLELRSKNEAIEKEKEWLRSSLERFMGKK